MSEQPIVHDEENTNNDAYIEDNLAIQEGLQDNAAAARRLFQAEATVGGVMPPTETKQPETHLKITPLGKAAGIAAAGALAIGGAVIATNAAEATPPADIEEVTVLPGDGFQTILEEHDPEVKAGTESWVDAYDKVANLPENEEVTAPGYVLKPGDTVSIPLDTPKESLDDNAN